MTDLTQRLRKASAAVYLATDATVAADLSDMLTRSADIIEAVDAWQRAPYDMKGIRWSALRGIVAERTSIHSDKEADRG